MAENKIEVSIEGDDSSLGRAISHASESVEEFGHAMHAIEGAFAFEKIKEGFAEVIEASSRAETTQRKFIGSMEASGQAADPGKFFEFAEALEKTTTYSKTATIEAASMFGKYGMGQASIEKLIPVVQDLSSFMGTDLTASAETMGRAITTGGEGLRALGLGFSAAQKDAFTAATQQERMAMIMQKVKGFAGGMAQAMTQTASGAMKQFQVSVEGLEETFGGLIDKPIAMVFNTLNSAVSSLAGWFAQLSPSAKDTVAALAIGIGVIGAAAAAFATLASGIAAISALWPALAGGFAALAGVVTSVILPIIGIGAAFVTLHAAWDADLGGMRETLTAWVDDIKKFFGSAVSYIQNTFGKAIEWISDKLIVAHGMLTGESPEQTGRTLTASHQQKGGLFGDASNSLATSGVAIGNAIRSAGKDAFSFLGTMTDKMKVMFRDTFGVDVDKLLKGWGSGDKKAIPKIAAHSMGTTTENVSFKDILDTAHSKIAKALDEAIGNSFSAGIGKEAAGKFALNLEKMGKLSDDDLQQVAAALSAAGVSGPQIRQAMADIVQQFVADTNAASTYWGAIPGQAQELFNAFLAGADGFAKSLYGSLGKAGQMIQAAVQGMETGGPLGAVVGVVLSMLAQSKSFTNMLSIITEIVGKLAQAFNPLIDAIAPILSTVSQLASVIGNVLGTIFQTLQPVFAVIGEVVQIVGSVIGSVIKTVATVLEPVFKVLGEVFAAISPILKTVAILVNALSPIFMILGQALNPLGAVVQALTPIFDLLHTVFTGVGIVILTVAKVIAGIWNAILGAIAGIIGAIGAVLPSWLGGDALKGLAKNIRGAEINMGQFDTAMTNLTSTTEQTDGTFGALQPPLDATTDGMSNMSQDLNGPDGFVVNLETFNSVIASGSAASSNVDPYFQASSQGGGAAGMTSSVVQDSGSTAGSTSASPAGAVSGPGNPSVNIGQVNITSSAPAQATVAAVQAAMKRSMFTLTGSTEGTYPNATPRTNPSPAGS